MKDQKTVFVGLSGGVDSSVAALRLIKGGYNVVGVFIKVWHPDFLVCNWEQERLDAMRIAAKLNIPFLTCDSQQAYKDDVAEYFISEYKEGRTPNPDVMCNKYVKFGAFLEFALENGADYIATGHYAQKKQIGERYELHRGVDMNKDQSYFLWTLTQHQLSKILLPVGDTNKEFIRKEAADAGLITAAKKDSQGVCFLGHIDIPEFLSHYVELQEGDVLNEKGDIIGRHKGALVYTCGQRHGFTVHTKDSAREALYVTSRNIQTNTIIVSETKPVIESSTNFLLTDVNYINWEPKKHDEIEFQSRYRQQTTKACIADVQPNQLAMIVLEQTDGMSTGQSCVLYDGSRCLGGGIIS